MPKYFVKVERVVQRSDPFEVEVLGPGMEELREAVLRRVAEGDVPWNAVEGEDQVRTVYYPWKETETGVPGVVDEEVKS